MISEIVKQDWAREQDLLGLVRDMPAGQFARGGLAALAVDPTVRIAVLPGDLSAHAIPAQEPASVIPRAVTVPDGSELPYHSQVRGTSSGYIGLINGNDGRLASFDAVYWHGGVDFFAGVDGGWEREISTGSRRRVIYLQKCVRWVWAAFAFQRQIVDKYQVAGPFRAILSVADTAGAVLGHLGAGWPEPTAFDSPMALEQHVMLFEDLAEWPDEAGVKEMAIRFGARLDLAFGGTGIRHLDRTGPESGQFNLR